MSVTNALLSLGVTQGDTVMVHASMRAVGGRAETLVEALLEAVGAQGTLMAYVDFEATEAIPEFDLQRSPAAFDYGVLAETIRTWPGARRSANPGASMAAIGAKAEWLTAEHPLDYGYGPGSPLAKLVELDGAVALLGSDLDQVTLLHYAEHLAQLPNKRVVRSTFRLGGVERTIEEFDTSDGIVAGVPERLFATITTGFIATGQANTAVVGGALCRLLPARPFVRFGVATLERMFGAPQELE